MSERTEWKGRPVLITSNLVPRFLWQTASIDVYVGDECVLRTGGQLKFIGSHTSHFSSAGGEHDATIKWGWASMRSFPIELTIDGERVLKARVFTRNWVAGLWPWLLVAAFFGYWATR